MSRLSVLQDPPRRLFLHDRIRGKFNLEGSIAMLGFYSKVVFPRLLDLGMASDDFKQWRHQLLATVHGSVLEIGFGTGLNIPHYPSTVTQLVGLDANPGMNSIAQKRIQAAPFPVTLTYQTAEALPFDDQSFDSIVSTWTLCSIKDPAQALQDIHRVLKPTGHFFFIEHGLSPEPSVQVWQRRLNPIQNLIGDGCQITRPIATLVERYFTLVDLHQAYANSIPKPLGYFYQGIGTRR